MKKFLIETAMATLASNPSIIDNISMPNINFPTMGGVCFWNDIYSVKGWRLQQNTLTQHYRILDPNNIRRAYGGLTAMEKLFNRIAG